MCSDPLSGAALMLAAVQFHGDPRGPAGEIDDVPGERQLPGEAWARVAEARPEQALFQRGGGA